MIKSLFALILFGTQALAYAQQCILPVTDPELVNTAGTLKEIEQAGLASKDQCKIFQKEFKLRQRSRSKLTEDEYNRATVLCGKWMFINLGMKTKVGIPTKLLNAIQQYDEVGPRMKNLGFLVDDSWEDRPWPFGIVDSSHQNPVSLKKLSVNDVKQISCAACHTGQLSDGRFSIGAANEQMDYGKFNIYTLFSVWVVDKDKNNPNKWHPQLIEKYQSLLKRNNAGFVKTLVNIKYLPANNFVLKYLVGEEAPPIETQLSFLNSKIGLYNGFAPSLNFTDRQFYIAAPQIYEIGTEKEAHYGSLAGHEKLDDFISEAFVYTTRSTKYIKELYIKPVKEFLKCLKAPKINMAKHSELYDQGQQIFMNNCTSCHNLSHGGGTQVVNPEIINTPKEYLEIFRDYRPMDIQSQKTFSILNKLQLTKSTSAAKVRRLNGIWTRKNLTSNGQIDGLDHLLCLKNEVRKERADVATKTESIHNDLCNNYHQEQREALKEFLLHF